LTKQQLQGVFRLAAYLSSWMVIFFVLAVPPAFSQQQKPLESPKNQAVADANQRLATLASATSAKQVDYVIGSGDLLGIEVFDVPELSREIRVNETGYISLPLISTKVRASGLTNYQLQDKIAELLQTNGLVSTPQVTVSLKEQRSQPVTVIGAVKNPQVIQVVRQTTLTQVLSQAGGIAEDAGNIVMVTRPPSLAMAAESPNSGPDSGATANVSQTFTIELGDLLESGDGRFDIPVLGGDVVSVPRAGIIYVVGAVTHPGGFVIQNDRDRMTALKMLSMAGGTTGSAKPKEAIILRKNLDTGKRDEMPLDLNKVMKAPSQDVTLQASDILFVPDSNAKKALRRAGDVAVGLTTGIALIGVGKL
jgi:polysaccharide export outer membrane protein